MRQPSQWGLLFDAAVATIRQTEQAIGGRFIWSFGGGTALMLQIDHRESHDVDLFIDDPQTMPFLNPLTQNYTLDHAPGAYDTDGVRATKLIYKSIGEIDFICCGDVTDGPSVLTQVRGVDVHLEPAEIVAEKVFYRGPSIQPRDVFDIAAVSRAKGDNYVVRAMAKCGHAACAAALSAAERFDAGAALSIISSLMHRETTPVIVPTARATTINLLTRAIS